MEDVAYCTTVRASITQLYFMDPPPFSLHRRFESLMSLGANSKKEREQFKRKMQSRKLEQEELPEGRSPQSGDFPGPALRPCFAH